MGTGTEIGRVRGLGSAKAGVDHWVAQRFTAVGNLALTLWLLVSLLRLPDFAFATLATWLASGWSAIPLLLLLASILYHMRLGLTVFIEDYVHEAGSKLILLVLLNAYAIGAFAIGAYAVARIALTGAPA